MGREKLVDEHVEDVRKFCWEHLAGILYRCVEHPEPRFDVDGNTARLVVREYADNNPPPILRDLTRKFLLTSAYQEVRKTKTHMPQLDTHKVVYGGLLSLEVLTVHQRLMFLSDDEFANLISEIPPNQRRGYQEQFLGRDVWELFYQRLKEERLFLDSKGYGRIKA